MKSRITFDAFLPSSIASIVVMVVMFRPVAWVWRIDDVKRSSELPVVDGLNVNKYVDAASFSSLLVGSTTQPKDDDDDDESTTSFGRPDIKMVTEFGK